MPECISHITLGRLSGKLGMIGLWHTANCTGALLVLWMPAKEGSTHSAGIWQRRCHSKNTAFLIWRWRKFCSLYLGRVKYFGASFDFSGIAKAIIMAQYDVFIRHCCSHCGLKELLHSAWRVVNAIQPAS